MFDRLIEGLGEKPVEELFKKYSIKPNRNKDKRCGQLFQYFQKNKSDKNDIIDYLASHRAGRDNLLAGFMPNIDSTQNPNTEITELPDCSDVSSYIANKPQSIYNYNMARLSDKTQEN